MIFEKIGKLFMTRKGVFLFFSLFALPILSVALFLFFQVKEVREIQNAFFASFKKGSLALQKKEKKEHFLSLFQGADPFFLHRKLESLSFLKEEEALLKKLYAHPAVLEKDYIANRLTFLSQENRLTFREESVQTSASMKESLEKQQRTVQMSEKDLKHVLSLIEHPPLNEASPQILIRDLRIEKKKTPLEIEFLEVEMELIKREFF